MTSQTFTVSTTISPSLHLSQPSSKNSATSSGQTLRETAVGSSHAVANLYRTRDTIKGLLAIFANYAISAACILLDRMVSSSHHSPRFLSMTVSVTSLLIIASRMRALENLVHEASHNNLFASSHLHERLQFLYAFPVFRLLQDYRRSHLIHHQFLGDSKRDPDVIRIYELGLDRLPEQPVWFLFGLPSTGFLTYEYLTTTFYDFWTSRSCVLAKTAYWAAVLLALLYTHTVTQFLRYYLVPFLVVLPVTRYWAEASEHLGLDLTASFGNSRTNMGFLHKWYMHPHNDGYHAVHHLHSQVPFHLLPRAHDHLMQASKQFSEKTVISRGVFETFRQMASKKMIVK